MMMAAATTTTSSIRQQNSSNNDWVLPSPRSGMMKSHTIKANATTGASALSISDDIDDWLGGMSLSDSEEGGDQSPNDNEEEESSKNGDEEFFMNDLDKMILEANGFSPSEEGDHPDNDDDEEEEVSNGDDEFFMNDLDKVILEANGFLEGVVASDDVLSNNEHEEDDEGVQHFGFNGEEERGENFGMSADLESDLESARQLAEGFTRFLVRDEGSMSPVAAESICGGSRREVVETLREEVDCGWAGGEEEIEEDHVLSESVQDDNNDASEEEEEAAEEAAEEEEEEEVNVEENEADWEGWNSNSVFFTSFDDEEEVAKDDDASQTAEPVVSREDENVPQVEPNMPPRSETKSSKPKLRIQIKGAPQFIPTKEEDEGLFYYASQPSPLARDDEQLLGTQLNMQSPVAIESGSSKTDTSPKKSKSGTSPKTFVLKKIAHQACPESDEDSLEESSSEQEVSPFHAHFDMSVSLTKSDETEKKAAAKTPPKLTIYIKGAPQFTPSRQFEEDAFYVSQPSPLFGDGKCLLSSSFASSPLVFEQKKESSLTSSSKKHFKNFVSKTHFPSTKYQAAAKGNAKFDQGTTMNTFSDKSGAECFDNDFFFAVPGFPVRQAKDAMKEGGSTKKKILGLLSGKKKKQNKGLYLLDD